MANNRLVDLNKALYDQLDRLNDPSSDLSVELKKSKAIASISHQIINNASLVLSIKKSMAEGCLHGTKIPAMLTGSSKENEV